MAYVTLVRCFACVCAAVNFQGVTTRELLYAKITLVGFLPCVRTLVNCQVVALCKLLVTDVAIVCLTHWDVVEILKPGDIWGYYSLAVDAVVAVLLLVRRWLMLLYFLRCLVVRVMWGLHLRHCAVLLFTPR